MLSRSRVLASVAMTLALLATGPPPARADDTAPGPDAEGATDVTAAGSPEEVESEPPADRSAADPSARLGFHTPTLDGPWRFRVAPYGWAPTNLSLEAKAHGQSDKVTLGLSDLLDAIEAAAEFEVDARKGTFGAYLDFVYLSLDFDKNEKFFSIKVKDDALLLDFGASYELGRWRLGSGSEAPTVVVEPYAGGRTLIDHVRVELRPTVDLPLGAREKVKIDFTVPMVGLKTVWDLTDRWTLRLSGEYGGFHVNRVNYTWGAFGSIGYRVHIGRVPATVWAGYRALQFEYEKDDVKLIISGQGPIVGLGFEF